MVVRGLALPLPEAVKSKVGEFEDEAGVHDTVARLKVAVGPQLAGVQEGHALRGYEAQYTRHKEGTKVHSWLMLI